MNALSVDMLSRVRNFFPDVRKVQLIGDEQLTHHYGLQRLDNNEFFGPSVSANYCLHTTEDICALVEAVEPVLGKTGDIQMGFRDGHYVIIQPTREHLIRATHNDEVFPRVILSARYGNVFTATLGMYRSVCSNLSMFHQQNGMTVKIRHTSGLRDKMADLIEDFHMLSKGIDNLEETIHTMVNRKVILADFINAIYPMPSEFDTPRTHSNHRRLFDKIVRRIAVERSKLGDNRLPTNEVTAWEAYNGVQGYVQHDKSRKGSVGTFDRAIIALSDTHVARAQHLALTM